MDNNKGMTEIVKTITSMVAGAIVVYGANIILYGHITPGGGFAGGLILAFLFMLFMLTFGKDEALKRLPLKLDHIIDSISLLGFLMIGVAGIFVGKEFLANFFEDKGQPFALFSSGIIPFENLVIGFKVAASIFLVFTVLSMFRREK